MNEEKQKILNIFDDEVKLKEPEHREKQEIIKKLIIKNERLEEISNGDNKKTNN